MITYTLVYTGSDGSNHTKKLANVLGKDVAKAAKPLMATEEPALILIFKGNNYESPPVGMLFQNAAGHYHLKDWTARG